MVGFWSLSPDNFVWGLDSRLYKYVSKWLPCIFLILSFSLHVKWFCIQHWWWTSYRPLLLLNSIHLPRLWLRQPHKIPASSLSLALLEHLPTPKRSNGSFHATLNFLENLQNRGSIDSEIQTHRGIMECRIPGSHFRSRRLCPLQL